MANNTPIDLQHTIAAQQELIDILKTQRTDALDAAAVSQVNLRLCKKLLDEAQKGLDDARVLMDKLRSDYAVLESANASLSEANDILAMSASVKHVMPDETSVDTDSMFV